VEAEREPRVDSASRDSRGLAQGKPCGSLAQFRAEPEEQTTNNGVERLHGVLRIRSAALYAALETMCPG